MNVARSCSYITDAAPRSYITIAHGPVWATRVASETYQRASWAKTQKPSPSCRERAMGRRAQEIQNSAWPKMARARNPAATARVSQRSDGTAARHNQKSPTPVFINDMVTTEK